MYHLTKHSKLINQDELLDINNNAGNPFNPKTHINIKEGSGILQRIDKNVTNITKQETLVDRKLTRTGERWAFDLYDTSHHEAVLWGGIEVSSVHPRNVGTVWSSDYDTGQPSLVPISESHRPPLKLYFIYFDANTWDQQSDYITVDDYDIQVVTNSNGVEFYKISTLVAAPFIPTPVRFEMVVGGLIDYYGSGEVVPLGTNEHGEFRSSIMIFTENELPDGTALVFGHGYFETEYMEWTHEFQQYVEMWKFEEPLKIGDRISARITYHISDEYLRDHWGWPQEGSEFRIIVDIPDARVGSRSRAEIYRDGHRDWIGEFELWDFMAVEVLEDGIMASGAVERVSMGMFGWLVSVQEKEIEFLEVTRRL